MRRPFPAPALPEPASLARGAVGLLTLPVELLLALIEWVLYRLIARVLAWPFALVVAVVAEVRGAHRAARARQAERDAQRHIRLTVAARQAIFREALLAVQQADQKHARFDPHFRESLEAATAIYAADIANLAALIRDPALRDRVDDLLRPDA